MIEAVYVEQYGAYWRLTVDEWRAVLESIKSGDGYTLGDSDGSGYGKPLRGRPSCVRSGMDPGPHHTWSAREDSPLYHPLDWGEDEARFHERDLPTAEHGS